MAVGIYVRISKADKKNHSVSNSIENQLILINRYIDGTDLNKEERIIFTDDGFSGRNGKRPSFRRLLAKMFLGEIDKVIVKDFSRLSRDHILVSEIRQIICPEIGVRLISVADEYDNRLECNSELSLEFRSLFDEYYCFDISQKVKSALAARKEEGRYAVAKLPFGYRFNECGDVVIKEDEAVIIRDIFNMAADSYINREISDVISMKYNKNMNINAVWRILNNPMYAGYHVWHKYENDFRKYNSKKLLPSDEWKYEKDDSVAVIDKNLWDDVRNLRGMIRKSSPKKPRHIFHGITKCGECGKALVRSRKESNLLVCRNCSGSEEEKISIDELFNIIKQFINDKCVKEYLFDEKYKEVFIQTVVKRVIVNNRKGIKIYWNFNDTKWGAYVKNHS